MKHKTRNDYVDWNRKRRREYEKDRALQALRNAMFFLFMAFVILGLAFGMAWNR